MLLSFLTQQNHQHTQSKILSWNTDAFPANFLQVKHKQLIKLITLFSTRTYFTIKPLHFQNQMTALLMNNQPNDILFTENPTAGARDSEKFVNPDIKSVQINIDGVPNMLYSKGMLPTDQWESIKQRFPRSLESEVTETEFYTEDKFALWIDLRSHADNEIHGSGLALKDTRDGVKLEIRRKVGGSGNITCDMFIVADALMEIKNSNLNSILY